MSIFEALRESVGVAELAGRFTELRRSGQTLFGRCPFPYHEDGTPSFHVYPDERFHCFGCRQHGDVTDLWAGVRGVEPGIEAALDLAREQGVELPQRDPEARRKAEEHREREDGYHKQAEACHEAISHHKNIVEWWESRGFDEKLRERFLLGTDEGGMAATIPFWNRGRVQGLIHRNLRGDRKYLYPKAEYFPGGYRPLFIPEQIRAGAFLVEGIVDALALAALGESAIAVGGTGISAEQMRELKRMPAPLYILPDADEEGAEAAREWVRKLYPKALLCPAKYGGRQSMRKDVADLFAAEGEEAREILTGLRSRAMDALDLALLEAPEESARKRFAYAKEHVLPLLSRLDDPGEMEAALEDAAGTLKLKAPQVRQLRKALSARSEPEDETWSEEDEPATSPVPEDQIDELVGCPGVLKRYVEDAAGIHGVVGERPVLRLQTLVALGAQLATYPNGKPAGANLIITAEPGRGKNHVCDAVASLLPEGFYLPFESASAKSLFYRAENDPSILSHVWIYPNEAEAADRLVEMFRPLLSGGKASHLTVNKDGEGRNHSQELNVEGPATITIPTVRNKLDGQLQTRMLVAELPDYEGRVAAHSRASSKLLLPDWAAKDHGPKVRAWQAALLRLTEVRRVVFDLEHDGFCFDSETVSHGARLWGNLLGLMLAHAWLEQRNREVTKLSGGERAVVATPDDYEAAYLIFEVTCERSILNLSDTHRKVLDAVYELKEESDFDSGFSQRKIAAKASVSVSTVSEHKTFLTRSVKLLYEAEEGGLTLVADAEPSWWEKGDLLVGFPRPEQVRAWWEDFHSVSVAESAEHAEHPFGEGQMPLVYAGKGVRHSTEHPPNTVEHFPTKAETSGGVRQENGGVRQEPEQENGLDKPKTPPEDGVFGLFGGLEGQEPSQTVSEGLNRLLKEHPEYRQRRPGQIACRLHMSRYTSFVPTEEEVEAAMKETL